MRTTLEQLARGELKGATRLDLAVGLTALPEAVRDLADTLEVLNLTGNALRSLPDWLPELSRLRVLFCSDNAFTELPEVVGACPQLSMVGFKSNQIQHVSAASLPPALRWLILTGNQIETLPEALGERPALEKVALAGNRLQALPDSLAGCDRLALLRLSANRFTTLPPWLWTLPSLSWLALAGNPVTAELEARLAAQVNVPEVSWTSLSIGALLGAGASGHIHRATWRTGAGAPGELALKLFKGELTSDGWPASEMACWSAAGAHPHLIGVTGVLRAHPEGRAGLTMPLMPAGLRALAEPPSLASCSRDHYPQGGRWSLAEAWQLAIDTASVLAHLHARGIMHGDFYGHNLMWAPGHRVMLGDFGAATPFDPRDAERAQACQRLDLRAWGCLIDELLQHLPADAGGADPAHDDVDRDRDLDRARRLAHWRDRAMGPPAQRPSWADVRAGLMD